MYAYLNAMKLDLREKKVALAAMVRWSCQVETGGAAVTVGKGGVMMLVLKDGLSGDGDVSWYSTYNSEAPWLDFLTPGWGGARCLTKCFV